MANQRTNLHQALLDFILQNRGDFNTLALDLFAYQYQHNSAYHTYCQRRGVAPAQIERWTDIPTVPTDVFRHVHLFCGQPSEAPIVFRTSGTTSGQRGQHYLKNTVLYHASARTQIAKFLLPDGFHRPALMLAPPPEILPDSSLSHMLGLIDRDMTPTPSLFAWTNGHLDPTAATHWLQNASQQKTPILLLATSFALVELFDSLGDTTIALPPGSIAMPTGGTKGRTRAVTPEEIEAMLIRKLNLQPDHIVSEYGMTELGSQLYDPRLANALTNRPTAHSTLTAPPWCRVTVHDPLTLTPVPQGDEGLLRFTDLSNIDSVCSVQTSDKGRLLNTSASGRDTITLLGRIAGARPRGCSLIIEEMMP